MLKIRRANERGHANHGWLDSHHTFSFGQYQDPEHMGFSVLRVINEDRVQADKGFGSHPHKNMEIISHVISGELEHRDSMGNGSVIKAGEFQRLSAGTGITHSEYNPSPENETHFYQIWVEPEAADLEPSYEQRSFKKAESGEPLRLIFERGGADGAMKINQDVKIYSGRPKAGELVELPLDAKRHAWIQVVRGEIEIAKHMLAAGDGVAISETAALSVSSNSESEFLFFDLP